MTGGQYQFVAAQRDQIEPIVYLYEQNYRQKKTCYNEIEIYFYLITHA